MSPLTHLAASEARYTAVIPISQVAWALPKGISAVKALAISSSDPFLPTSLLAPVFPSFCFQFCHLAITWRTDI